MISFTPFSFAQQNSFNSNDELLILKRVEDVMYLFQDNLNTLGDTTFTLNEKETIIQDIFDQVFKNKNTPIFNNLYTKTGSTNDQSEHLAAELYLGNIVTFFKKGISFEFTDPQISKVLFDCKTYERLVKATIYQSFNGIRMDEPLEKKDMHLDVYFTFNEDSESDLSQPRISAIGVHTENDIDFTPIYTDEDNTTQINNLLDSLNALISESHMSNAVFIQINSTKITCPPKLIWLAPEDLSFGGDIYKRLIQAKIRSTAPIKEKSVYINNDRVTSRNLSLSKREISQVNGIFYEELIEIEIEVRPGTNVITIEVIDENNEKVSESNEIIA